MAEAYPETTERPTNTGNAKADEKAAKAENRPASLLFQKALRAREVPETVIESQQRQRINQRFPDPQEAARHLLTVVLLQLADREDMTADVYLEYRAALAENERVNSLANPTKKAQKQAEVKLLGATATAAPYSQMLETVTAYQQDYDRRFVEPYTDAPTQGRRAFMNEVYDPTEDLEHPLLTMLQDYRSYFKQDVNVPADRLARMMLQNPNLNQADA